MSGAYLGRVEVKKVLVPYRDWSQRVKKSLQGQKKGKTSLVPNFYD